MGVNRVQFVGDAKMVVDAINYGEKNLYTHLQAFSQWKISYISREANLIAHELAKMATSQIMDKVWVVDPPVCIQNLIVPE